jgi:HK97 family phage major capsid protein
MKMSERIKKMLAAKRAAFTAAETRNKEATTAEELRSVGATLLALKDEIAELEAALADAEAAEAAEEAAAENTEEKPEENRSAATGAEQRGFNPVATYGGAKTEKRGAQQPNEVEQRAQRFAATNRMAIGATEARSVLISSGKIATPTEVGGISEMFNTVSSIVDMVKVTNCEGMGKYRVAIQTAQATAAKQTEGAAAANSEPAFAYVDIDPETAAVLSYISKQVRKQSPLNYEEKVRSSALVALRAYAAKLITDKIVADADKLTEAVALTAIGADTLRKIALNYGGDENVVGDAVLFLSKKDLVAFGDVRGTQEKKAVYEITPDTSNPNTGIIKDGGLSVKYCLNSNLAQGKLIYGQPKNFELGLFGNYEINVSDDFAIDKLMLTIVGDVELGGAIIKKGGFVVATVGAGA